MFVSTNIMIVHAQATSTTSIKKMLEEIYPTEMVTEARIQRTAEISKRITIVQRESAMANAIKLSSIELKNKHKNLSRDVLSNDVNLESVNPFKYFLNFYPETITYYHIDNTNFYIQIDPLTR